MSNNQLVANEDSAVPYVIVNPDGTYTRPIIFPTCPATPNQHSDIPVLSKDVTINAINKTGARIHIRNDIITSPKCQVKKLPVFFYYHGGGFVVGSSCTKFVHDFCDQLAAQLSVVVVSVDFRPAPEHRLPAAYEDGVEVLHWVKSTQDPWLTKFADLLNCYIMGTSAGANLAYHAGLRASIQVDDLEPLKIKGLILHHLFIGGMERTDSEIRLASAKTLNLSTSDLFWDFCLPVGANRDHEYSNLILGNGLDRIKEVGWGVMMPIRYGDLMSDRQIGFAKTMELKGIKTKCFYGEGEHGVEYFDKAKAKELLDEISSFMSSI
uniref:probable carboxylesterase 120 n=1 Tax=Erigeron canadensis TaxID=72917 RepID=UPI001CB8D315|nr:probable carboxylesterase 120 [Erigeron canadensis]